MKTVPLKDLISPAGAKAGSSSAIPVYSVTKHAGFVPSMEYFKKQVFSRELSGYKRVQPGDFAYATIHLDEGSIGIAPAEGLISPMYTVFRANDQLVEPRYLLRYLKSPVALAQYPRFGKGTVHRRKSISLSALGDLSIPLPPLDEQRRIAAILDQANEAQHKQQAAQALLTSLRDSVFVEMFGGLAEQPLGPKLAFLTSGGRGWAKYYADAGTPFIRSLDVRTNRISTDDLALVEAPDNAEATRTRTRQGDVLLTITGSRIGRAAPLPDNMAGAYVSQHVAILRPRQDAVLPDFLSAFLCAKTFGQRQIGAAQYGQTKPGLNFEQIRDFRVPAAGLEQQFEFRKRMLVVQRLAEQAEHAERELAELFDSIQARAFAGEL